MICTSATELPVLMTEKDAVKCAAVRGRAAVVRAGDGAIFSEQDARQLDAALLGKTRRPERYPES